MTFFGKTADTSTPTERLWTILGDHNIFMLVTHANDNKTPRLRARPMAGYPRREEGRIWFLAHRDGLKDDEIERDQRVCITHADSTHQQYVSLTGHAAILIDVDRKRELWSIAAQAWFPGGPEDPNVLLIQVDLDEAEFWDGEPNSIVLGLKMANAVARGKPVDVGDNESLSIHPDRTR